MVSPGPTDVLSPVRCTFRSGAFPLSDEPTGTLTVGLGAGRLTSEDCCPSLLLLPLPLLPLLLLLSLPWEMAPALPSEEAPGAETEPPTMKWKCAWLCP